MTELTPSMLELMDQQTLQVVENWRPMGLAHRSEDQAESEMLLVARRMANLAIEA
jgi:hypothetical protein